MHHHLISLFVEYTQTLNHQQLTTVDCSDQLIYALTKINQWLCRYFPSFGCLHIEKALLVAHGNLIRGSGLEELLGDKQIQAIALDVNHTHKG